MTSEQVAILRGYLHQEMWTVTQINYLQGGNISGDTLTVVTEQKIGSRMYRFVDSISPEGQTTTKETELQV